MKRRVKPAAERFWAKVDKSAGPDGCWPWTGFLNDKDYGQFSDGERLVYAHRFAWALAHGPIPDGQFVCHRCDRPACCNETHFFLGSHTDNMRDCAAKGRYNKPKGEKHSRAKLSAAAVLDARRRYASGEATQPQLAAEFGVDSATMSRAITGKRWRHLGATS